MSGTDFYNDTAFDPGSWSDTVIYAPAGLGAPATVQVGGFGATTVTLNGNVGQDGATVTLTIETGGPSIQRQLQAVCDIVGGGVFTDGAGDYYVFSNGGLTQGDTYDAVPGYGHFGDGPPQPACFVAGTRIETRDGPVAVEALRPGDLVRAVLRGARGAGWAPVVWTGHRHVLCARHARDEDVWPVRVVAGAFGPGRPGRDLYLSPDHAVFDSAALIPVRYLINDATVAQVPTEQVTYWHVELPSHDVLLAEGLETETLSGHRQPCGFRGSWRAGASPGAVPRGSRPACLARARLRPSVAASGRACAAATAPARSRAGTRLSGDGRCGTDAPLRRGRTALRVGRDPARRRPSRPERGRCVYAAAAPCQAGVAVAVRTGGGSASPSPSLASMDARCASMICG